ncbi:MAG TPA: YpmA family protein [Desulfobacteria bacterium]|nr:YpmA family protein [Desulfobacteria bacterium]
MDTTRHEGKLELIAVKTFPASKELYMLIDFLNKSLKEKKLMFGISKNGETMTVSVYEV